MTLEAALLVVAFLGLLALPLLPGLRELRWPRDDAPMPIDQDASLDPRQAALTFREQLRATEAGAAGMARVAPTVHVDLRLAPGTEAGGTLVVLGDLEVGEGARLGDVHARGHARLGPAVRLRSLAADGDLVVGADCTVLDWVDTEATAWIGLRSRLGRSASAAKGLHLQAGCTFQRLWGSPITVDAAATPPPAGAPASGASATIEDALVWVGRRLTLPAGLVVERDLVVHGELRLGAGVVVRGTVKAHGAIRLEPGVRVDAHVIGRRGIHVVGPARIAGNIFAEGDVVIGPGTRIGDPEGYKSVYTTGRVTLAADVVVFGGVVAEVGGGVSG